MKFDRYELFARIFPSAICSLPYYFFYHFFNNTEFSEFVRSTFEIKFAAGVTMFIALLFSFYQLSRLLGKILETFYFQGEKNIPTTEFLLYGNEGYSLSYKEKIRWKIKKDFGTKLMDQKKEVKKMAEAKKLIIESVRQIRHKVKSGRLVLNRNIEYGFFRNLIAGGFISLPASLYGVYFFSQNYLSSLAVQVEAFFAVILSAFILSSFHLLKFLGKNYANALFQEYLN